MRTIQFRVIFMAMAILCLAGAGYAAQGQGAGTEQYESKVIITGKWGDKLGELGLFTKAIADGPLGPIRGPASLDIDKDGNIYIFDAVNWRVVVYSPEGKHTSTIMLEKDPESVRSPFGFSGGYSLSEDDGDNIKVDSKKHVYIHTEGRNPYTVREFGGNGKLQKLYIDKYLESDSTEKTNLRRKRAKKHNDWFDGLKKEKKLSTGQYMWTLFPTRYLKVTGYIDGAKALKVLSDYNINRDQKIQIYRCGGWLNLYLPEKLKELEKNIPSDSGKITFLFGNEEGYIEKTIVEQGTLAREDKEGNVYFINSNEIRKYDFGGHLISTMDIATEWKGGSRPFISADGNVYKIVWDNKNLENGFRLIVWHK